MPAATHRLEAAMGHFVTQLYAAKESLFHRHRRSDAGYRHRINAAVFMRINAALFEGFPLVQRADRIVQITTTRTNVPRQFLYHTVPDSLRIATHPTIQ